jgi:RHS repeat-associated protein
VGADLAYAPYGEVYNFISGAGGDWMFTGDVTQLDSEYLWDTPNREFAINQGRWLSPDPAGTGWNQYAYPTNPLSYVDPSGLYCAYLNDAGDDSESIDSNSDEGECASNGGYWIQGDYGAGSWVRANADTGIVTGLGYDSSGNAEISFAGAQGSNAWGAWTQTFNIVAVSSAANNESYAWTFTKAFFKNFSLSAVYHSFGEGGCDRLMAETFADAFNPLPGNGVGPGDVAEIGPNAVAGAGQAAASAYSVYQGLSVPLRSSIYRGLQSSTYGYAGALEEAAPYAVVVYAGGSALYTAGSAAYNGECH